MALKIVKVTDTKTSEQFESLGLRAFEAGDLDKAAENLLSALQLNDKNADLYLKLGVTFVQQGTYDKALIAIKQCLELDPYNAAAFNAMGVVLFRMELWGAAEKFFRKALSLDPAHATAKTSLVEAMKHLRDGDPPLPENFELVMSLLNTKEPTLSLCMIVKNEEEFLEGCLASVKDVVNEMIIVDTGSTDRTVEIAEQFGAKVFHYAWHGDFAAARNESLQHATGDWILVLDADERVPAEWHTELKKAIRNQDIVGYSMVIENLLGAKGESRQMAMIFRLFRNLPELRYEGIIHEQIILAAQRTGKPIGNTLAHIVHHGYLNQYLDQRDKHQRNLAILLEQEKQESENPYVHFNLGQTYKLLSRHQESECSYLRCLELLKGQNASHSIAYYANLYFSFVELYRVMGEYDKGLALADEAIEHYPTYPDILFSKGHLLLNMGRFEEAIQCFEACRKYQGVVFAAGTDPSVTTYKSSNAMGVAYSRLGKNALAKQHFQRALQESSHPDAETHANLGILFLQEGDHSKALDHFTKAVEIDERYFRAWFNMGTLCFKLGEYAEALVAWLKAQEIQPDTDELNYLIGEAFLKVGEYTRAAEAFERELSRTSAHRTILFSLGIAHLGAGEIELARDAWHHLESAGTESRADAQIARAFSDLLGDQEGALPDSVSPERLSDLWSLLLDHMIVSGQFEAAERAISRMLPLSVPGLALGVAKVLQHKGLHEAATAFLLRAREQAPENAEVYSLLGRSAAALDNAEDARVMFQMALSLDPRDVRAREQLGRLRAPQPIG